MGTLLGLGAVLAYHNHCCRVSGEGTSLSEQRDLSELPRQHCKLAQGELQ